MSNEGGFAMHAQSAQNGVPLTLSPIDTSGALLHIL
jgi:hypothetical protein